MEVLLSFGVCVWVCIAIAMSFMMECFFPTDPNTTSLGNGEWNCLSVVGHVIGDKKYECIIWNLFMKF